MTIHKEALISEIKKNYSNTTGIIIQHKDNIILEEYFNKCNKDSMLNMFSVTKTVISLLIGIAIDKGYIKNINQNIKDFIPTTNTNICIKDLMRMSVDYNFTSEPYMKYFQSDDYVSFALDYIKESIENFFRYTPLIGVDILSEIIKISTNKTVSEFANEHLFIPLDITPKENISAQTTKDYFKYIKSTNISGWFIDEANTNPAGWGLTLSTGDMLKIGNLIYNNGKYNDTQIISSDWINTITTTHNYWFEQDLEYGYLIWIVDNNTYAAMGDGGNIIYINKENELICVMSGLHKPKVKDRITLIKSRIEPYLD